MPDRDDSKGTQSSSILHSLDFVCLGPESCYHSSIVPSKEDTLYEIRYNIRENMAFDVEACKQAGDFHRVTLVKYQQLIYSRYSLKQKMSTFIVANARKTTERLILEFTGLCKSLAQAIHPFNLHLALMFDNISAKGKIMEKNLKTLLSIAKQILNGNLIAMKLVEELGNYSQ